MTESKLSLEPVVVVANPRGRIDAQPGLEIVAEHGRWAWVGRPPHRRERGPNPEIDETRLGPAPAPDRREEQDLDHAIRKARRLLSKHFAAQG